MATKRLRLGKNRNISSSGMRAWLGRASTKKKMDGMTATEKRDFIMKARKIVGKDTRRSIDVKDRSKKASTKSRSKAKTTSRDRKPKTYQSKGASSRKIGETKAQAKKRTVIKKTIKKYGKKTNQSLTRSKARAVGRAALKSYNKRKKSK